MPRHKYLRNGVFQSFRVRFLVVNRLVLSGAPMDMLRPFIKNLLVLIAEDYRERRFDAVGYRRFCIGFYDHYFSFPSCYSIDAADCFFDRFYLFVDDCFPIVDEEEVIL